MRPLPYIADLDTSAIIAVKEIVPPEHQQHVFDSLTPLVDAGRVIYCVQVVEELQRAAEEDLPLRWARANRHSHCNPAPEVVRYVLERARDVMDPYKEREDADPYVLALAVERVQQGDLLAEGVVVVTNDYNDYRHRISMATACQRLNLPWKPMEGFLMDCRLWPA